MLKLIQGGRDEIEQALIELMFSPNAAPALGEKLAQQLKPRLDKQALSLLDGGGLASDKKSVE